MKKAVFFLTLLLVACNNGKPKDYSEFEEAAKENIEYAKMRNDSARRADFVNEYAALDAHEKDSILYLSLSEVREGTDIDELAGQTYNAASRKGINFKACVILDGKGNEVGRYE